jgi:hypothetical protein
VLKKLEPKLYKLTYGQLCLKLYGPNGKHKSHSNGIILLTVWKLAFILFLYKKFDFSLAQYTVCFHQKDQSVDVILRSNLSLLTGWFCKRNYTFIFNKTNRRTNSPSLVCQGNLHVSVSSSAHHQEFSPVHLALVYVIKPAWHIPVPNVCLFVCFPGVTTHFGCIFHSPVAGFSLLVFEVSWSHTTTRHSR